MDGVLGTRGTLMLDLVAIGMVLIVPLMFFSIRQARSRNYLTHKRIQLGTATVLLMVLIAFEVEMRLVGWRHRAESSPLSKAGSWNDWVEWSLLIHLFFAVPTVFLWGYVVFRALRGFSKPPQPGDHSPAHRWWGRISAFAMTMTATTGFAFYYVAFVM